jgi:hypothetical protein
MGDKVKVQLANLKQAYRDDKVTGAEYRDQKWSIEIEARQDAKRTDQAQRWR